MAKNKNRKWLACLSLAAVNPVNAAPIDGEIGSNAAAVLMVLGIWALLMGMRNLRELRHKRLVPARQQRQSARRTKAHKGT